MSKDISPVKGLEHTLKSSLVEFTRDGFPIYNLRAPICQIWISGLYGTFDLETMRDKGIQSALANLICRFYSLCVANNASPEGMYIYYRDLYKL